MKNRAAVQNRRSETAERCGYCEKGRSLPLYSTRDFEGRLYSLNRCLDCRAIYLSPRPDFLRLEKAYDQDYYGCGEEKFSGPVEKMLDLFRLRRAGRLHRLLRGRGSVLDIGCGNGRFLAVLESFGNYRLHGIEPPGGSAARATRIRSIHLKTGRLEKDDFPKESLDAVTLFHVFEHLESPRETVETIAGLLKPGGILILSFPNIESFQAVFFRGRWLHLDPPRHLFFLAPSDLGRLMERNGFDLVDEIHLHPDYNPFGFIQSTLNCLTGKREMLYEYLKGSRARSTTFSIAFQTVFAVFIAPVALLLDFFDSLCGRGATVEMIFRKRR